MAVVNLISGQAIQRPEPISMDSSLKTPIFESGFKSSMPVRQKAFENYFQRVHKKYSGMDTTNIENLVDKILQEKDSAFLNFIREQTSFSDTFYHRFTQAKTPLGKVLQELQNSQESPNRKLLSKEIFNKAENEAVELIRKDFPLFMIKEKQKNSSDELNLMKKREIFEAVKIGSEFRVNTYMINAQWQSSVASLKNGTFVVTWQSEEQNESYDIYGQIFDADGTKNGSEFQVNTYAASYQTIPSVTSLSNGKFVVVWNSLFQDGSVNGVYGQIFNLDGTKNGEEFLVNTYTTNVQTNPSIASLNNDTFVVTWESYEQDGSGLGVYGQIFNLDGTKSGPEFQVNTYTTSDQNSPSVASLNNDTFVVTWESLYQDGSGSGIYGQIFNLDGTKKGVEFPINTYTTGDQRWSSVASLNNDAFVVIWSRNGPSGFGYGVYGQIFNLDGTKKGVEFRINTNSTNRQGYPSITNLNNDTFVVTWDSDGMDGYYEDVYGQILNSNGTKIGSEFRINNYRSNRQGYPSITNLNNDTFVVTWDSDGQDGGTTGVYGQIFEKRILNLSSSGLSSSTTPQIRDSITSKISSYVRLIRLVGAFIAGGVCIGTTLLTLCYLKKGKKSDSLETNKKDTNLEFTLFGDTAEQSKKV